MSRKSFSGDFDPPIGDALSYSASGYADSGKKRVSYNLYLYGRTGETDRVPVCFGDERKLLVNVPNSQLPTDEIERASFLKSLFVNAAQRAFERYMLLIHSFRTN